MDLRLRMGAREPPTVTTIVGSGDKRRPTVLLRNGPAATAALWSPYGIAVLPDDSVVFTEVNNHCIRRFDPVTGDVTVLAGTGGAGFQDGPADRAQFSNPRGLTVDGDGNVLVADTNNHRIRCLDMTTNNVTTLAGTGEQGFQDGPADRARFNTPRGISIDRDGNVLVADTFNHRIRCIHMATRHVTTLAGTGGTGFLDGPAARSQFNCPSGIVVTTDGNVLVSDSSNHRIRCFNMAANDVTTLAGTGEGGFQDGPADRAQFNYPIGLAVDGNGNVIVADTFNNRIRFLDMTIRHVTTLAGTGEEGFQDAPADRAQFKNPTGVAVDGNGNVLVTDIYNDRIRLISNAPNVAPLPLGGSIAFARAPPRGTFNDRLAAHRTRLARAEAERTRLQAHREAEAERADAERARLRAQLDVERARLLAELQARFEDDMARVQAGLDGIDTALAAAVAVFEDEAAAVRELEVEAEGFCDRVATEGIDQLDTAQVYEFLRLLDVTTVTQAMLEREEINGAMLQYVTEDQMQDVFKMQRFGDRRRLRTAIKRLLNRQGFPLPAAVGQPGALGWGAADVGNWLRSEEFPALVARFETEGIDGPCLLGLQAGDLRLLGIGEMTVAQSSRLQLRLEALKKITYAGQVVRSDGGAAAAAAAAGAGEADPAAPAIQAVLQAVLDQNEELQKRVAERAREPARAEVPNQFLCPILQDVMEDPVVAMDGFTYERAAIEAWFRQSDRSPMTNLPIPPVVVPNIAIRQQIAELQL
jgi:outer membrane protein assembly factor BamB